MDNLSLYPKYRWVMAVLINLAAQLTHAVYIMLPPMLTHVAADFGVSEITAGYAATVHGLVMGLFMFVGTIMIGWIDNRRTQITGITIEIIGVAVTCLAQTFPMLIFARILTGMGHGISGACTSSVISAWFPSKEKPMLITLDTLGFLAITSLTLTFTAPLYHALGDSWRMTMLVIGGALAAVDLLWLFFARDNHALNAYLKTRDAAEGKKPNPFAGMTSALKRRDVWMFCLCYALYSMVSGGITTYLPQFLQTVRGLTDTAAGSVVGVANAVGAGATFLGGVVATALGRRRPIIIPSILLGTGCLCVSLASGNVLTMSVCFTLFTIFGYFRSPALGAVPTELKDATPTLVSSASSLSHALGFIGAFAATPMLSLAKLALGDEHYMLAFIPLLFGSAIFAALMPETGPGRRKSSNRQAA